MRIERNVEGRRVLLPLGLGLVLGIMALTVVAPTGHVFAQEKAAKGPSLYQRMGGYDGIVVVLDDVLAQLQADPAFKRFSGGRSGNSLKRTRQLILDQFCEMTGGPCTYIGRDMKTAHAGLQITEAEWDSFMKKLQASLDKAKIAPADAKEFTAMIQKFKGDIVEPAKPEAAKTQE